MNQGRDRLRPEEWEQPNQGKDSESSETAGSDPANEPIDVAATDLPDDHPFAQLMGHDPRLTRGMAVALKVLGDRTTDEGLRRTIADAAAGRVSFRDLVQDPAFGAMTQPQDESAVPEKPEDLAAGLTGEAAADGGTAAESTGREDAGERSEDERVQDIKDRAAALVARLTDNGRFATEVEQRFSRLGDPDQRRTNE